MSLSWFPGHMAKALGEIRQSMKLIDVVIEILDARAPRATANPYLDEAVGSKPRVLVLNKADLAELLEFDQENFARGVALVNAPARIWPVSARTGAGIAGWVGWLEALVSAQRSERVAARG